MTYQQPPQPQQPQYQPQPHPQQYMQVKPPSNGLATASLVLGIVTAVSFISVIGWVMIPITGILALIFGFIGISTANKLNGLGKGKAVAGVILGFSPMILSILILIFNAIVE